MKKYSKSKKVDSCARWRERSAGRESSRGKIIPWTLEIIMTGDDSVNLSIRRVCIRLSEKNKYRLLGQNIVQLKKKENESTVRLFAVLRLRVKVADTRGKGKLNNNSSRAHEELIARSYSWRGLFSGEHTKYYILYIMECTHKIFNFILMLCRIKFVET